MDEGKDCEVCGRGNAKIFALVDGVKMRVCEACSKFGKVIEVEKEHAKIEDTPRGIETEEEIVEDYADIIKNAREKKGITRTELAAQMNEKESFLKKVEAGESPPSDQLADKLEKALKIKLYEVIEITKTHTPKSSKGETTFGDLIEVKKKKK